MSHGLYFTFTYDNTHDKVSVEQVLDGDSTLPELLEKFKAFLLHVGYAPNTISCVRFIEEDDVRPTYYGIKTASGSDIDNYL